MTWQHWLTDENALITDLAMINIGFQQTYTFARVAQTRCKRTGMMEVDGVVFGDDFPGPQPVIRQHYMKREGQIRSVWYICAETPVVIDCMTRQNVLQE
jgi:hypothetical protein